MSPRPYAVRRCAVAGLVTVILGTCLSMPAHAVDPSDYKSRPGSIDLVSLNSKEAPGNGDSGWKACGNGEHVSMSDDGRYVAFASVASDLDPHDGDLALQDVFVRDRLR